jgi:hypothetical protein
MGVLPGPHTTGKGYGWICTNVFSSSKISLDPSEVALLNLSESGGTSLHSLHVVVLQCFGKTLVCTMEARRGGHCLT